MSQNEQQQQEEEERPAPILKTGGARNEVRGVDGRVQEMRVKFDRGTGAGQNPMDAERRRLEAQSAKAHAARYNMVLRGQQIMQARRQSMMANRPSLSTKSSNSVLFEPHEFSEEWEDYPWHLAAAFTDEDDAFWMPELAMALEKQDEMEINRAVLRFFLEEMDPDRVDQLDDLLVQFEGQEELLFLDLHNTYGGASAGEAGEEEAKPKPAPSSSRRASFVVSGMKKEDGGWEMNNAEKELMDKMKESGEVDEAAVAAVLKVAESGIDPFEEKSMTIKRRNHGRNRHNRGQCGNKLTCDGCGCKPVKDKAVKRFTVKNIVDNSSMRDIKEASAYEVYTMPKFYIKMTYCVGCAVHRRIVRGRPAAARKVREPPMRRKFKD